MLPKTASSCRISLDLAWLSCTISVAKQVLVTRTPPLVGFQRVLGPLSHYQPFTRFGEDFNKIVVCNVLNFLKCVLGIVGCSNSRSVFPQAHWARKSTWYRAKSLRSLTGRTSKNFWIFQKSHYNTQEARVCAGSAVSSPKLTSRSEVHVGLRK